MKNKILLLTFTLFLIHGIKGSELKINLTEDEAASLARFEALHQIACEKDDTRIYTMLFSKKGRESLNLLSKDELKEVLAGYPEVIGISLMEELSRENYVELVGTKMANHWANIDEAGVRFFKVEFKFIGNGSAPNYIILKNGVFYKAVL